MPEKTARGGINACEPPFLCELEKRGVAVREEIYTFDNDAKISIFQRLRQVRQIAAKFRRILRAERFDLLHLNTSFDKKAILRDAFSVFRLKKNGAKIFLKFHGADVELLEQMNFGLRFLIRYLIENADGIGVLSAEEKRGFINFGFAENKFFVVKNALIILSPKSFPQVENFSPDKSFRLLFVSRLIPTKGLLETIRAVSILRDKGFDVFLDVCGDGETRPIAENLSKTLKISEFVKFHGHISEENVRKFYRESDVLVFPTFHIEGFPMVIFNALQFGLPIVTTKIRAAADYLRDGENVLFCEPKNAQSVAEKIAELIQNKDLREAISKNNRVLASEFTAEKIAPEYLEIYRKILR